MAIFFTSDHHFGHRNIIDYTGRPFRTVPEMNRELIWRWNNAVNESDTVYHLGDFAMGSIDEGLEIISQLNGTKILIVGNHDRPFAHNKRARPAQIASWSKRYLEAGFAALMESTTFGLSSGEVVALSHFPYEGDHFDGDRFEAARLPDQGLPLLHGHTHKAERVSHSKAGTLQIHVGVDAWEFTPVHEAMIARMVGNERRSKRPVVSFGGTVTGSSGQLLQ